MPYYDAPNSDMKRLSFLMRAAETAVTDRAAGRNYVSQENLDALNALAAQFEGVYNVRSSRLSDRAEEVAESEAALEALKVHVRDLWEVVRRRVHRKNQPAAVLNHYQLPADGTTPDPGTRDDWMRMATAVIVGDAEAVEAGYEAAVCPSAAEVQAALSATEAEIRDIAGAERIYDEAQEAVAALRPAADALIQEVVDELRYTLRKFDGPSQRRIMRTYGAEFKTLPGEEPEEEVEG